jgi:signal transduction histidine kinase
MRRRYADLPIHLKILAPFAILMIVWGGFGTAILTHGTASEARARATAQLATAFDGARAVLSDDERSLLETERLAANTQGVAAAVLRRDRVILRRLLEPVALNAGHDRLRIVDPTGAVVLSIIVADRKADIGRDTSLHVPAVLLAARGATDERGDKFAAFTETDLVVAGPIRDARGDTVGALVVSDELTTIAGRMGRGTGARVVIFADSGTPLAANGGPLPFRASSSGLHVRVGTGRGTMEALYGPLDVRGARAGMLAIALPSRVVLAGVEGKTRLLAVLVGIAVLVALGIGLLTARAITRPVGTLIDATRALQQGDLSVRTPQTARDEIGTLATSFNSMAAELEASHHDLERKVVERTTQLREANAELVRVSSAKSAFLGVLSHELRTPLNGILGFADMLSDPMFGDHSPEETRDLAVNIMASGRHLLGLIDDLLDLAKIEAGKLEIKPVPIDVATVAGEVESALRPLARDKRLVMTTEVDMRLPRVLADPARLRQVLFNLVANAIKFTPDGGVVALDAQEADGFVTISVVDTGPGMRPDEIDRIFQPYERGDAGREEDGAGLGLALARSFVELQGGRIWVESVPGHGSTFFVSVPVAVEPAVSSRARAHR